jgi:glycosyltransferase involved in cell wall biosynthesis
MASFPVTADPTARKLKVVAIEADGPYPDLDLTGYEAALVILTVDGAPIAQTTVGTSTGQRTGDAGHIPAGAVEARVRAQLWWDLARLDFERRLRARIGGYWWQELPRLTKTVVVCTRDRQEKLARCLQAISGLDPAPDRVLVVDNASREPCRTLVEQHGFAYVQEPMAGLDNARNRGLAESETELIVYTDDDCLPASTWLSGLERAFSDPMVGAVTGIGTPYRLDSEAQLAFEAMSGFVHGYRRRRLESTRLQPVRVAQIGAGCNMAYRASVLREVGGFAPELDVGTPTRSGGDLYTLARVLASGRRVVYDPGQMVWHDHRADVAELRRVMHGYGVGLGSFLTRCLVVDRELPALRVSAWAFANLMQRAWSVRRGSSSLEALGAAEMARGVIQAPAAWRRSLREQHDAPRPERPPSPATRSPASFEPRRSSLRPDVSVVVPTMPERRRQLAACLAGLAAQGLGRERFEIIVVPNGAGAERVTAVPGADRVLPRPEPSVGIARNSGATAASAPVIVFIDDDVVPDPGCLAAHLTAQRQRPGVTLGPYWPARPGATLIEQTISRWWYDHLSRKQRPGHRFTFVDFVTGNVGFPAELFRAHGGFDTSFPGSHREDWEMGCRLLAAGVRFAVVSEASARHYHTVTLRKVLRDTDAAGYGDVILSHLHPQAHGDLPLGTIATRRQVAKPRWARDVAAGRAVRGDMAWAVDRTMGAFEAGRMRLEWSKWYRRLCRLAYRYGVQRALDDGHALPSPSPHRTVIDLERDDPIEPGIALGEIVIRDAGWELGTIGAPEGQWDVEAIVAAAANEFTAPALLARASRRAP